MKKKERKLNEKLDYLKNNPEAMENSQFRKGKVRETSSYNEDGSKVTKKKSKKKKKVKMKKNLTLL